MKDKSPEVKPKSEFIRELLNEFLAVHYNPDSISISIFVSWLKARNGILWLEHNEISWCELREICLSEVDLVDNYKTGIVVPLRRA